MAKLADVFPSKYLKAEVDVIEGKDRTLKIKRVEIEGFENDGKKTTQPVLYFRDEPKGMVCNKTNSKIMEELYGDETDDWEGKTIVVQSTEVPFGKDMVWSLRIVKKKTLAIRDGKGDAPKSSKVTQADADEASAEHAKNSGGRDAGDDTDPVPF